MSALGHKRTFRNIRSMSAIPPKADIEVLGQLERVLPSVPAAMTMPSNAGSDHHCDHHDQDGRVHAASMCDTPQARHSKV